MSDQRTDRRQRVLKAGTITFNGSGIDCVVRNISASGAALEVESQIGIPSEFNLVIATENVNAPCRILWRKANRMGVIFYHDAPVSDTALTPATPGRPRPRVVG